MELLIPTPTTFLGVVWFLLGIQFGRSFGKKLDRDIQDGDWFEGLKPFEQWVTRRILDFFHHWWIGALMVLYIPGSQEAIWFGWGLIVDDLPDIPRRFGISFSGMFNGSTDE